MSPVLSFVWTVMSDGLTRAERVLVLVVGRAFVLRVIIDSLVSFQNDFLLRLFFGLSVYVFGRDGPQWALIIRISN